MPTAQFEEWDHPVITELLDALARDIPSLPGAACRGHEAVMDVATGRDRAGVAAAQAICATCPAFHDCKDWLDNLPKSRRPGGVVAGRYNRAPSPQPRPERPPQPPTRADRATSWLRDYLQLRGPTISTQLRADAQAAGHTLSAVHVAGRRLGVRLERLTGTRGGQHLWSFPYIPNRRRPVMTGVPDTMAAALTAVALIDQPGTSTALLPDTLDEALTVLSGAVWCAYFLVIELAREMGVSRTDVVESLRQEVIQRFHNTNSQGDCSDD